METDDQLPQTKCVEDDIKEGYYGSHEYLQQCQSRLISKVEMYKSDNKRLKTASCCSAQERN